MSTPKAGVVTFPGSNCDTDLLYVLGEHLGLRVTPLWHKTPDLQGCGVIFLPGGFSYGDYLRTGAIARFAPIMQEVKRHAEHGGKVIGICNGFQILAEAGLLPGALRMNAGGHFLCRTVPLRPEPGGLLKGLPRPSYRIPLAHMEGNYYCDPATLNRLEDEGRILCRYADETGDPSPEANPNGSVGNIAGVCNVEKNVVGLMPHPERAADPLLGNTDGLPILQALLSLKPATV